MDIFFQDEDYVTYKEILSEQCLYHGTRIVSYCLMTNHVHLIAIPETEVSLAKAIGEAHRLYTRYINFKHKQRGHLFQERFFSTAMGETHFFSALRYVENNPVRAKMVKQSWEYPYSSASYRVEKAFDDALLSDYEPIEMIDDYRKFLEVEGQDESMLRERTRTGRPYGDEQFYDAIEAKTGKDLRPKKAGRKKK
jgi:putative transposase